MYRILLVLALTCGLMACSEPAADLGEGPTVELLFKEANPDDRKAMVTVINRRDKAIKNLRGEFIFKDAAGEVLTHANGSPQNTPFSKAENPHIVDAKEKKDIDLPLSRMPEGAKSVEAKLVKAIFKDDSTFEPQ